MSNPALNYECPTCNARVGEPCKSLFTDKVLIYIFHKSRKSRVSKVVPRDEAKAKQRSDAQKLLRALGIFHKGISSMDSRPPNTPDEFDRLYRFCVTLDKIIVQTGAVKDNG